MRILVVGDSYLSVEVFRRGFEPLEDDHDLRFVQLDESLRLEPRSSSERAIREYAGSPDQLVESLTDRDALVIHGAPVTAELLTSAPRLRLVACARGGPVNVDVGAATELGIAVVTTPGKNAEAVADLVLAFMIMLIRCLPRAQATAAEGQLGTSAFEGADFFGRELAGRRLGLVGFGHVGQAVTRRALALDMQVAAFDPYLRLDGDSGVRQCRTLDELLGASEIVSIHARASSANENLIGERAFALMPKRCLFINAARATLVDEQALATALSSGHLGGAALDVVRPLRARGDHPLLALPNVIVTPHIGGATEETLDRGVRMLADEIEQFARGEPLRHVANPQAVPA